MELRHLRYFVAVAEEENVTRASSRLHVSQPALSRQIRDLEEELGVLLLERTAKAVRLTEAGKTFLLEARAVLQRADEAVKAVRAVAGGTGGEIHVGYAPSLTVQILPQALRICQAEHPGVRVMLHDLSTEEMVAGLRDGKLNVALMVDPGAGQKQGLHLEELARYPICVALAPNHPLAGAKSLKWSKLADLPLIGYSRTGYPEYHESIIALFEKATGKQPHIAEEHDSVSSLIASVEAGHGVALVPTSMRCMVGPRLEVIPLTPAVAPIIVYAARRAGVVSVAVQKFVEAARMI
jgi:DNA-binding transcriptional LysR family regulator